ncbi:hypothetical protein [Arthrobacter sp. NPDC056493]|uniref:hypothetical protein n=1 Tax=Arthrobacter sp. NPDC056493 TaxID=3345839 RepID=UPI003670986C
MAPDPEPECLTFCACGVVVLRQAGHPEAGLPDARQHGTDDDLIQMLWSHADVETSSPAARR